jgi:hypothetical protein
VAPWGWIHVPVVDLARLVNPNACTWAGHRPAYIRTCSTCKRGSVLRLQAPTRLCQWQGVPATFMKRRFSLKIACANSFGSKHMGPPRTLQGFHEREPRCSTQVSGCSTQPVSPGLPLRQQPLGSTPPAPSRLAGGPACFAFAHLAATHPPTGQARLRSSSGLVLVCRPSIALWCRSAAPAGSALQVWHAPGAPRITQSRLPAPG